MAIFTRRVIQAALNRLKGQVITAAQHQLLVKRLNCRTPDALHTEWEILITDTLAKQGSVKYERPLKTSSSRPDVFFRSHPKSQTEFVADITTVSDRYAHDKNAIETLFSEIRHKAANFSGGIDVRVDSLDDGPFGNRRVKLKLPSQTNISGFVTDKVGSFFEAVTQQPDQPHSFQFGQPYLGDDVSITLYYHPARRGMSGGYAAYDVPYSLTRNPLSNRLREKARSLISNAPGKTKGVIVCDGGCAALRHNDQMGGARSCASIVNAFMRDMSEIDFVVTASIHYELALARGQYILRPGIYCQAGLEDITRSDLVYVFTNAFSSFPSPVESPSNALRDIKEGRSIDRGQQLGFYSIRGDEVTLSTRTLLALLSNSLSQQERQIVFDQSISSNTSILQQFFLSVLASNKPLIAAKVIPHENEDDDWIQLTFGAPSQTMKISPSQDCEIQHQPSCRVAIQPLVTTLSDIPISHERSVLAFLSKMRSQGRSITHACVETNSILGNSIVLSFGSRDAAVSDFY